MSHDSEYLTQANIAEVTSQTVGPANLTINDMTNYANMMQDDHGYPISGDHLPRNK